MWNRNRSTGFQPVLFCASRAAGHGLKTRATTIAIVALLLIQGCAEYVAPGPGANLERVGLTKTVREASTDGVIQKAFDKKPLANFPTSIAVARVQAPGYTSSTAQGYGSARTPSSPPATLKSPSNSNDSASCP